MKLTVYYDGQYWVGVVEDMDEGKLKARGVSTHAQQALKLECEARKQEKQSFTRQQRDEFALRKRELKRIKAIAKHRGKA